VFAVDFTRITTLTADDAFVYWMNEDAGTVRKLEHSKPGGEPTTLVDGGNQHAGCAVLVGDTLYYAYAQFDTLSSVWSVNVDGGDNRKIADGQTYPWQMAADDAGSIFWTDEGKLDIPGSVVRLKVVP
jgi:hypothetical protein